MLWPPTTPAPIVCEDWLAQGKYRDPQEFVESIPFTETREYVQAILRNANVYKQLYGTP